MDKTGKNLKETFSGESQAYHRYLAFAERAADEYKEGIDKLFQGIAESEKIHARRRLGHLKAIKGTAENLKEAMKGEMHEFKTMYPKMITEAKEEQERGRRSVLPMLLRWKRATISFLKRPRWIRKIFPSRNTLSVMPAVTLPKTRRPISVLSAGQSRKPSIRCLR